ncbi:hypothetical protein [Prosthecobacter sp.]|uniref:hypothetical protein n=1 Tax=Prosthecobacter sp. TaxID=1965333 RepID=UPI00378462CD
MQPRLILLSLVGLLLVGVFWRPGPSIRFVAFKGENQGRVAVFKMVNDSGAPYSIFSEGLKFPHYCCKIYEPAGWRAHAMGWCGTGSGWHTLAPHSVTEFEVSVRDVQEASAAPFVIGIYFERGSATQLTDRTHSGVSRFFSGLISLLREKITGSADPDPTWSDVVQP